MCPNYMLGHFLNDNEKNKQLINKIMTQITELQYDDLVHRIYETFIMSDDMGLADIGSCTDEAKSIVDEWIKDNNITIIE